MSMRPSKAGVPAHDGIAGASTEVAEDEVIMTERAIELLERSPSIPTSSPQAE